MVWGRLYGGGAVIIGADDGGAASDPLDETKIRSVKFLQVVDRRYLVRESYFTDPNAEHYGEPATYRITPRTNATSIVVHRSRMLLFGGAHTSDEQRDMLGGWDHSVLLAAYEPLRQFDSAWKSGEHLLSDASQAVFKIQGLMSMIAGGQKDVLQTRMQLVDMSRSVARALLLDADGGEEFSRQPSTFTDATNMVDKFMLRLAAAGEIPVTLLMGQSPAGMNATGESDFRWFYDSIRTSQENDLKPQLERLVRILFLAADGPTNGVEPDAWDLEFAPLWQQTPSEQETLRKTVAERDKIYLDAGVLLPEEVALARFRPEGFSTETQIDRASREAMLAAELAVEEPTAVEVSGGNVVLAPTDIAIVVTVNEARKSQGLEAWPIAEEGALTVAEFKARKEQEGAAVGAASGEAAAAEIAPAPAPTEPEPGTV
jgi:hypothetical protein